MRQFLQAALFCFAAAVLSPNLHAHGEEERALAQSKHI